MRHIVQSRRSRGVLAALITCIVAACGASQDAASLRLLHGGDPAWFEDLDGSVVTGTITVELDAEAGVDAVSFFLDAKGIDAEPAHTAGVAPFRFILDSTLLSDGSHLMLAAAGDASGSAIRLLASATFTVDNAEVPPDPEPEPDPEPGPEPEPGPDPEPEPEPEPDPSGHWRPGVGLTWFWQLSGTIDMSRDVDVYDIDYLTPASVVAALHAQGKKVIAYVPVGDWEDYRPDSADFPESALCGNIPGWPERYIDIRHPTAVQLIKARIALAASRGFDGIEGDVVDLHLVDTGCTPKITEAQMTSFLEDLSAYAHSLGLAYFAKNVPENAAEWSQFTDGVVVEEAYQYGEAAGYMPYVNSGKPVFAVEYGSSSPTNAQCADANSRGYALFGTNLALTGIVYKTCW